MLSKHVVLTMRIINIIINTDNIRQERLNKGSNYEVKWNTRINLSKQETYHTAQGVYGLSG